MTLTTSGSKDSREAGKDGKIDLKETHSMKVEPHPIKVEFGLTPQLDVLPGKDIKVMYVWSFFSMFLLVVRLF